MKKGYIYSAVSAILFGSAGIIIKYAYAEGTDSINLLTLQYVIAVIIMLPIIFLKDKTALKIKGRDLLHTAILGIVGNTFMTVFYYLAFSCLTVPMVAILLYTYPIMVFLYSFIFEKKNAGIDKFIALILAFLGCFLALGLAKDSITFSLKGIGFGVLAAVFYAFMNIYTDKSLSKLKSLTISFYSTLFSLLSLIIYRFPHFMFNGGVSLRLVGYTTLLSLTCEIIPLTLLYAAIKYIGALKVSIIGNLEIPTAMILSYIFFRQPIAPPQILGAAMVIYAVYKIRK